MRQLFGIAILASLMAAVYYGLSAGYDVALQSFDGYVTLTYGSSELESLSPDFKQIEADYKSLSRR